MKIEEFVQAVKKRNDKAMAQLPDKRATAIVRTVVAEIRAQIEATNEGELSVPGLGKLIIKQATRTKDGKEIPVKRVLLRVARMGGKQGAAKAGAQGKGGKAGKKAARAALAEKAPGTTPA